MVTTEQEERRSVLQVPTSRYSQAFHDGIKDQTQGVVLIASEVDIVMFDSCFRTYCGEGDEEAEYGAVVDPGDYRWSKKHEETISFRRRVNHISNLERQINYRVERQRRENIYASSIDIDDYEPPVFAKSQDEKDAIQAALADNFIFQDLDDAEKNMFIDAMQRKGDVAFIDGQDRVGETSHWGSFGELALLYNAPRAVSCVAVSRCVLWRVDQRTFRHIVAQQAYQQQRETKDILHRIELFKNLDDASMSRMTAAMQTIRWKPHERIVQKGQQGSVFYVIKSGHVNVHDIGLGDSVHDGHVLGPGRWFGERALLTGEVRAANVTAVDTVETLAIDRATFDTCLGSLHSLLEIEMRKSFLRSIPAFVDSDLTSSEIDQLALLFHEVCYREGEKLATVGEPYTLNIWVIRQGRLLVYGDESLRVFNLESGDFFGEKSFVGDRNHISRHTAIAETNLTTWVLTREQVEGVIGDVGRLGRAKGYRKAENERLYDLVDVQKHKVLGEGAFGQVWLVTINGCHKDQAFALKQMSKSLLIKTKQYDSVRREKEYLSLLQHPFILHLYQTFQDETNLYVLLPLVPGGELFSVLERERGKQTGRGLPMKTALFCGACIVEALGHFHLRSIAYRDLKLENVLIDKDGYIKMVDLGFAKMVTSKTYTLIGTPEYLAPEILLSRGHDKAVDYWSLGVLCYELLAGMTPFFRISSTQAEIFRRIVQLNFEFPGYFDRRAKDLIEKLLVRDQANRLGNLSRGHVDIKRHEVFTCCDISFRDLVRKRVRAPWVPKIANPLDSSNFDEYSASNATPWRINKGPHLTKEQQDIFNGF